MAFKDHWGDYSAQPISLFDEQADLYKTDIVASRLLGRSAGTEADRRIVFVYESEEAHASDVISRCMMRAEMQHNTNSLERLYCLQVADHKDFFEILCKQLDMLQPDAVVVASRAAMRRISVADKKWRGLDKLQLINRLHDIYWGKSIYPTIVTLPDDDVLLRNSEGKVAKESVTRLGDWVGALVTALRGQNLYTIDMSKFSWTEISTLQQFDDFFEELGNADIVSIDTETDNLNRVKNTLGMIQFAFGPDSGYALPIRHPQSPFSEAELEYIFDNLREYFEQGLAVHIYANAKFDLIQLQRELGYRWYNHDIWDIQAAEMALDENRKFRSVRLVEAAAKKDMLSSYSLAQLALEYGSTAYLETNMGKDERNAIFRQALPDVSQYGVVDVVIPYQIYQFQMLEIERRGNHYLRLPTLIKKQFASMIHSFVEMELTGLPIDRYYLTKEVSSGGHFSQARETARREIYAMPSVQEANKRLLQKFHGADLFRRDSNSNWVFDIDKIDHQQLLFFDVLKLEPTSFGKDGRPSVNKAFKDKYAPFGDDGKLLEEIAVAEVAEFRLYAELKHLYSSFLVGFQEKLYSDDDMRSDGRLRPEFIFLTIITGRSGARKPSLQQVPSRSKLAPAINRQFVAPEGTAFLKSDFIAHEVKNWMLVSRELVLARIFIQTMVKRREFRLLEVIDDSEAWAQTFKELDLHRQSAQHFFGIPAAEVPKDLRTRVKTLVFGTVYGMSPFRLSKTLGISVEDAEELQRTLFEKYPDGSQYIEDMHEKARELLYVTSAIGRIRHLWGYLHTDFGVYGAMDRRAVNSAIQSLASDEGFEGGRQIQKLRWHYFHSQDIPLRFSLANMVHDSQFSLTDIHTIPIGVYLTEHGMTTRVHSAYKRYYGFEFTVGLELDFEIGPTLGAMHSWDYRPEKLDEILEKTVAWQRDNMKFKVSKQSIDDFYVNADIIRELRDAEISRQPDNGVSTEMLLTRKIAREELIV